MRKLVLLAGLLLACAPEVPPLSDAAPPPAIGRVPYPQVRGQPLGIFRQPRALVDGRADVVENFHPSKNA